MIILDVFKSVKKSKSLEFFAENNDVKVDIVDDKGDKSILKFEEFWITLPEDKRENMAQYSLDSLVEKGNLAEAYKSSLEQSFKSAFGQVADDIKELFNLNASDKSKAKNKIKDMAYKTKKAETYAEGLFKLIYGKKCFVDHDIFIPKNNFNSTRVYSDGPK